MRFLHTSDWQMGMRAPEGAGAAGDRIRQARLQAARNVLQVARDRDVDFICIAGDTFETNDVDRILVRKVAELLAEAPCPVYILPGNHDPLLPGSVWEHPVWAERDTLHVLGEPAPTEAPGGLLWPCPVTNPHSSADPTVWIEAHAERRICVGVAHGNLGRLAEHELPIPEDAATRSGLDYLALGHWHSYRIHEAARLAYSGCHEPTKFGERDSGNVLVVDIPERGAAPRVDVVPTRVLTWHDFERDVFDSSQLQTLAEELEAFREPTETLVRLRLTGVLPPDGLEILERIQEILESRFLLGRLETSELRPLPDDDAWIQELSDPLAQEIAGELLSEIEKGTDGKVAMLALRELLDVTRRLA